MVPTTSTYILPRIKRDQNWRFHLGTRELFKWLEKTVSHLPHKKISSNLTDYACQRDFWQELVNLQILSNPSYCFIFCGKYRISWKNYFCSKVNLEVIKSCHCFSMQRWLSELADHLEEEWWWWWEVTSYAQVPGTHWAVKRALHIFICHIYLIACVLCFFVPF